MTQSVFVLRHFDGVWPTRVEAVILAQDRYEATEKANDYRESIGAPCVEDENISEIGDAHEDPVVEDVFRT